MEEDKKRGVDPFSVSEKSFAWESIQMAKHQTRLWFVVFLITFAGLIGTNAAWLYVYQLYDYVDQSGDGINTYNTDVGGDIFNGAENQETEQW